MENPCKEWRPPAVIYDLDGCLFCNKLYSHMKTGDNWCWVEFAKILPSSPVNEMVKSSLISHYQKGYAIILLTARPDHLTKTITKDRLAEENIMYRELIMMDEIHFYKQEMANNVQELATAHAEYKRAVLKKLMSRYDIKAAYDDQQKNIDMYLEHGIMSFKTLIP